MKRIDNLEQLLRPITIQNLTRLLVIGQTVFYILSLGNPSIYAQMVLRGANVRAGEIWRLVTFMFLPPATNPLFAFFALYIFYMMGTALEVQWNTFRYNLYIFIAYFCTIIVALLMPGMLVTNIYIESSVFLAFAYLFPNFEFLLFFILPVKVKYLAMFTWITYGLMVIRGGLMPSLLIAAAVVNFFMFFGKDMLFRAKIAKRRSIIEAAHAAKKNLPFHICSECKITEKNDPHVEFRVCEECSDGKEYCEQHINAHAHC